MSIPDPSGETMDKLELERIEDLVASARKLAERAVERLSIENANWKLLRTLARDAHNLLDASVRVLDKV